MGDEGFWAGRMDSFLKPLPLDDQTAGRIGRCSATPTPWRAASCGTPATCRRACASGGGTYNPQGLLLQAPHPDDVDATPPFDAAELMLGTGADERRVVYTQWNEPGNRRLFTYPSTNSQKYDLWDRHGNRLYRRRHRLGDRGRRARQRHRHPGAAREGGHDRDARSGQSGQHDRLRRHLSPGRHLPCRPGGDQPADQLHLLHERSVSRRRASAPPIPIRIAAR